MLDIILYRYIKVLWFIFKYNCKIKIIILKHFFSFKVNESFAYFSKFIRNSKIIKTPNCNIPYYTGRSIKFTPTIWTPYNSTNV